MVMSTEKLIKTCKLSVEGRLIGIWRNRCISPSNYAIKTYFIR
jgi:hypothetical protein